MMYDNVPKIWLAAQESTDDNPVLVPFTYGEALENVPVELDFSAGDMVVTMPEGYMARSAVVIKPELLSEENIREGVTIAGILGKLTPGKNVKLAKGSGAGEPSSAGAVNSITVTHGLGVIPELIIVMNGTKGVAAGVGNWIIENVVAMSTAFKAFYGVVYGQFGTVYSPQSSGAFSPGVRHSTYAIENTDTTKSNVLIHNANQETFKIGTSSYKVFSNGYRWIAIAGLTE